MFKDILKETVVSNESLNSKNWKSDVWKSLASKIDQDVLNDAYNQHSSVKTIFNSIGTIIPRKCKKMSRIALKTAEVSERGGEYFKVISDFVAGRIHCKVEEIPSKIDELIQIVKDKNGYMYVRGESEYNKYGFSMCGNEHTDITQYIYVYLEDVGYVTELQIGHEFATYTFTVDSMLRDDPECGRVDLWKDGFYGRVKNIILKQANNVKLEPGEKYEMLDDAQYMHDFKLPQDLKTILNKI